jgi:hypothetical protein
MVCSQVALQSKSHRAIGGENHADALTYCLSPQSLYDGFIEQLDARPPHAGISPDKGHRSVAQDNNETDLPHIVFPSRHDSKPGGI